MLKYNAVSGPLLIERRPLITTWSLTGSDSMVDYVDRNKNVKHLHFGRRMTGTSGAEHVGDWFVSEKDIDGKTDKETDFNRWYPNEADAVKEFESRKTAIEASQ